MPARARELFFLFFLLAFWFVGKFKFELSRLHFRMSVCSQKSEALIDNVRRVWLYRSQVQLKIWSWMEDWWFSRRTRVRLKTIVWRNHTSSSEQSQELLPRSFTLVDTLRARLWSVPFVNLGGLGGSAPWNSRSLDAPTTKATTLRRRRRRQRRPTCLLANSLLWNPLEDYRAIIYTCIQSAQRADCFLDSFARV